MKLLVFILWIGCFCLFSVSTQIEELQRGSSCFPRFLRSQFDAEFFFIDLRKFFYLAWSGCG